MPQDKEFRNINEQYELLDGRGVKGLNSEEVKSHLMEKGYFNLINGFETLLLHDPKNPPKKYVNIDFQDFLDLYDFDMQLASKIFSKISEFETKLKSAVAYHFTKNHCSSLADNNNYIDINFYKIPGYTDGPEKYVRHFTKHKLFRNNYWFEGKFKGTFSGSVYKNAQKDTTILNGDFIGKFDTTPIREIKNGTVTLKNIGKNAALVQQINTLISGSNSSISCSLTIKNAKIYGLNYIDECKINFEYIKEYKNPPFWVAIKPLMMNDLLVLLYGLDRKTFNGVLKNFGLKPIDREKILNSIAIIKELRNTCAHFDLVNRFRTTNKTPINQILISELNLKTLRSQYVIRLYDTLKILNIYVDLSNVMEYVSEFYNGLCSRGKKDLAIKLIDRMGNSNINEWN